MDQTPVNYPICIGADWLVSGCKCPKCQADRDDLEAWKKKMLEELKGREEQKAREAIQAKFFDMCGCNNPEEFRPKLIQPGG